MKITRVDKSKINRRAHELAVIFEKQVADSIEEYAACDYFSFALDDYLARLSIGEFAGEESMRVTVERGTL